jgi:hypothetical protein
MVALALLVMALPLLIPQVPPLTDLPGHMGRYKIALELGRSAELQRFFEYRWSLVPNLGGDLLVVPLAGLLGVELATKVVATIIPPLTLLGFLFAAREAHGRLPPTWMMAAPLIYGFPFLYGFLNFTLAVALAFLALGLWIRLGRTGRLRLRAALFLPLSLVVWVSHAFGWGMLGLLAFSAELARELDGRRNVPQALFRAALNSLPLAAPLVPMIAWGGHTPGGAHDWFNLPWKLLAFLAVFRDRWQALDIGAAFFLLLVLIAGLREPRLAFTRTLGFGALALLAAFILLPRLLLGGAHTDNRLVPYLLATALLALAPSARAPRRAGELLAAVSLAFFVLRMGAATASAWVYGEDIDSEAAALDKLPKGARMAAFVGIGCPNVWARKRLDHLPSLAIVRRDAFSNDQWTVAGSHLLKARHPYEAYVDPSQMVAEPECREQALQPALAAISPERFDYVWLIQPPAYDPAPTRGWVPVWRRGSSVLFRLPPVTVP